MYRRRVGERASGGHGFHPCESQRIPRSEELVELPEAPGVYWERLDAYEEAALETLAEKTGKRVKQIKKDSRRSHKRVSRTDWQVI